MICANRRRLPLQGGLLALLACALVIGCGDDGLQQRYAVSGKLTRKGEPLSRGTVNFVPVNPATGRAATGDIQPDGTFSLTTQDPGDGAFAGDYRVVVNVVDIDDSKLGRMPNGMPILNQPKKIKVKSLIPAKFSDPNKTDLTAKVEPDSNYFVFDLNN